MALSVCKPFTNETGREITLHGTTDFPAACYDDDIFHTPVPWHWHDELELILVTEGVLKITTGNNTILLSKGNGLFLNTAVLHAVDNHASHGRLQSIVFHPRIIGGASDSIFWEKYLTPILTDSSMPNLLLSHQISWQNEILLQIKKAWNALAEESAGYEFLVRDCLSKIVYLLSFHHTATQENISEKALRDEERIKLMLQFIQEHFSENLKITQIASSASISVSECLRCFRNTIGIPPIQYLKQYRIQQAAELLKSPSIKISDIAHQCGFQEMSYFSKTFRLFMGCTPSEYQNRESS